MALLGWVLVVDTLASRQAALDDDDRLGKACLSTSRSDVLPCLLWGCDFSASACADLRLIRKEDRANGCDCHM